MNVNKLNTCQRRIIVSEVVSLQYLSATFQRIKYADLCRKYSRAFICGFYSALLMRYIGEDVEVCVWDWAATNCAGEEYYREMLDYGISNPMTTVNGVVGVIKNCCMRYNAGKTVADRKAAKTQGAIL